MAETLFGSGSPLWPTLPIPGFGYIQALQGNRVPGPGQGPMGPQPGPFATAAMLSAPMVVSPSADPTQMSVGWPPAAGSPFGPGVPTLPGSEFTGGITPQALLAVVAMRRGQPMGPTNDQEIEDFISDALDLLSGAGDVEIRCENGRALLTGTVPNKRVKRDVGEIVWAIPTVNDVQNNITIAARRRSRAAGREAETGGGAAPARKQT